ncbi:PadR family transcriptional regulator [Aquamicrobium sp. LC103]|uniref:PadR family transcriptional regulator n=1 Tax=Aquamicrobium sp. LC103 TaxID=1120658 RepID=UPI00063E8718|nr:PadR family transcriptional regulator [Aquamicrobium sp. LC103]TKT80327.1 PadR family transcriptional regulator [Aquamicrobium sp. LC103]
MRKHHHCGGGRVEHAFWQMAGRFGGGRGRSGGSFGGGMRGGPGGPGDMLRAGRMLGDGDLKLITLALLAEAPRHGYDIIRELEERSSGFYSPSPGVVYPTLTFLEEAGYAASLPEGNKKVFSITDAGRTHLKDNEELVERAQRALDHLERFGRKMAKAREWFGWDEDGGEGRGRKGGNSEFRIVRQRLRAALAELVDAPAERQQEAIDILKNAAEALEGLFRR